MKDGGKHRRWVASARRLVERSPAGQLDAVLAAAVIGVIGFGVVMVYSASAFEATVRYGNAQHYLTRQAIYAVLSLGVMWLVSRVSYRRLRQLTYPLMAVVVIMLVATIAGFGHRAGNAYRWLEIGPVHVQPSEVAKVVLVMWLAYSLSKKAERMHTFWVGLVPHLLVVGVLMLLCLKQPDFGSAVVLFLLTVAMLFVAGARLLHVGSSAAVFGIAGVALVRFSAYRYGRFLSWLNMDEHRQGLAYQPFQSVMSFGSGGLLGMGLGHGLQVLYLPEAHNDFIIAIVGEELGFVGVMMLCAAYGIIVLRGMRIAFAARDDYGAYLAFGLSSLLALQVLLNLSVAMALLPTKGLTLPFVSYGGSSLLVSAGAIGVLLNVGRETQRPPAPEPVEQGPAPSASAVVVTAAEPGGSEW